MTPKFLILALPRSRTAWLARWLAYGGRAVGHDIGLECNRVEDFFQSFWNGMSGTVETGAARVAPLARDLIPGLRIVVVRRNRLEVEASLQTAGMFGPEADEALDVQELALDEAVRLGATEVGFADLRSVHCCAWMFEHLLEVPFDFNWWQMLDGQNAQIDLPARVARIRERAEATAGLKAELEDLLVSSALPQYTHFGVEGFAEFWPEARELAVAHKAEVGDGVLALDVPAVVRMEALGAFRVIAARINGVLVGYCTWTIARDIESGRLTAQQGAWYSVPGKKIGLRLLMWSRDWLAGAGVADVEFHHHLVGRGAKLGQVFERLGAAELKRTYRLVLGTGTTETSNG